MALQTKVFSSATTSNGFTLALTITENSTSIDGNTSSVSYSLALKSGGWNFAQWRIGWSISLGGTVVSSQSKSSAPQFTLGTNSSITIARCHVLVRLHGTYKHPSRVIVILWRFYNRIGWHNHHQPGQLIFYPHAVLRIWQRQRHYCHQNHGCIGIVDSARAAA